MFWQKKESLIKIAMKEFAKEGFWHGGAPPFGYSYNKNTRRLDEHPIKGNVVQFMFKTFVS